MKSRTSIAQYADVYWQANKKAVKIIPNPADSEIIRLNIQKSEAHNDLGVFLHYKSYSTNP